MKLIVVLFAAVALTQALELKPAHINPPAFSSRVPFHRPNPRITGGVEVQPPHSLPHQVGLFINNADGTANFCGGSLISPTTVLTAAHCGEISNDIDVILGAHYIRDNEPTQVVRKSQQITVHPQWDSASLINDIALIRIEPVELNENIQTIRLPRRADADKTYQSDVATASGWGKDSDAAQTISTVLRRIDVPVAANSACNIYYLGSIRDSHICTTTSGGKSTCSGDSGGPLVASTGELIGATSFGISLGCEIGWPAVFTRISKFLDFIGQHSDVVIQ